MQSLVDTSVIRLFAHAINRSMVQFFLLKFRFFTNDKRVIIFSNDELSRIPEMTIASLTSRCSYWPYGAFAVSLYCLYGIASSAGGIVAACLCAQITHKCVYASYGTFRKPSKIQNLKCIYDILSWRLQWKNTEKNISCSWMVLCMHDQIHFSITALKIVRLFQ